MNFKPCAGLGDQGGRDKADDREAQALALTGDASDISGYVARSALSHNFIFPRSSMQRRLQLTER